MELGGVLPEDAPDPRIAMRERLRDMPSPVMGLVPQPSLEDTGMIGGGFGRDAAGYRDFHVTVGYTLWRNPADRSDPVNLAALDEATRASLDEVPPWPRPAWLIEQVERMRYPQLWDAVWTTWNRDATECSTLTHLLLHHANHVLRNQFREERGWVGLPGDHPAPDVTEVAVNRAVSVVVDGVETPAEEIDTDPFVYAIGVRTAPDTVATAVLPRDELPHLRIAFATRPAA